MSRRSLTAVAGIVTVALVGTAAWYRLRYLGGNLLTREAIDAPAKLAAWPWPNAVSEPIHPVSEPIHPVFVKEPDAEGPSLLAAENGISLAGGWSVPDVARFFVALGAWEAINSDAGDAGQLLYRTPEGRYELIPPKWSSPKMRMTLASDCSNAPQGGTLMYWVVRDRRVPNDGEEER